MDAPYSVRYDDSISIRTLAFSLFLGEHKPDIECLFAKTADIVRALSAAGAVLFLGGGAKCIGSRRLQGHPVPVERRTTERFNGEGLTTGSD